MKKCTLILLSSVALLAGCETQSPAHRCVLLKFPQAPAPALVAQLAATQPDTTPAEVAAWFQSGERGFILSSVHTNEIAAAVAAGASTTVLHASTGRLNNNVGFGEKM
jgi:DNA-binding NarL/FixJ family response regulator